VNWKGWLIVAVLLVVLGVVLGGVYAGLIASAIGGAAVQRARRREREHIQQQQEIKKQKITKIEQINRDLKMETKVLQHKTNADLKRDVLKDATDILGE